MYLPFRTINGRVCMVEKGGSKMTENDVKRKDNKKIWDVKVVASFIIAIIFIVLGFYKLLVYRNDEDLDNPANFYVGGDAYNYIINAGQATAYFVLTLIFVVVGCAFLICNHLLLNIKGSGGYNEQ